MEPNRISLRPRPNAAFTLVEMLTVMAVIIVLTGLVLGVNSGVQFKAAKTRAEGEIASLSAACEAYRAENGGYPRSDVDTDVLDPKVAGVPSSYAKASLVLYSALSGDMDLNSVPDKDAARYFEFRPEMLGATRVGGKIQTVADTVRFIQDPWGSSYGYSTIRARDEERYLETARAALSNGAKAPERPSISKGFNVTFDLWSTGNSSSSQIDPNTGALKDMPKWVKNW
jgi:type II secretory pathway pseudopilin PulG